MSDPAHDPIAIALAEDIGEGDVTCAWFVEENQRGDGRIVARQEAIAAGVETAAEVFRRVDETLEVAVLLPSGSPVRPGTEILHARGSSRSILAAERVALNFLQRLSGIATLTARFVEAVKGTGARILDTRKTTPGLRALEKEAVRAGGGRNHRFGLFDMVMIKDNHLAAKIDRLAERVRALRAERPEIGIEVEADTLDQVRHFLTVEGIDVILLDNMTPSDIGEAIQLGKGHVKFEASGGVSLETVAAIAATGVDYISVGALTHSAPAVDFSLDLKHVSG